MNRDCFLKIKALAIAIDKLLSEAIDEDVEQAIILSEILVATIKEEEK